MFCSSLNQCFLFVFVMNLVFFSPQKRFQSNCSFDPFLIVIAIKIEKHVYANEHANEHMPVLSFCSVIVTLKSNKYVLLQKCKVHFSCAKRK